MRICYPGLDIMRNWLNIRQQQRLDRPLQEMTALRAATIKLVPLVRGYRIARSP